MKQEETAEVMKAKTIAGMGPSISAELAQKVPSSILDLQDLHPLDAVKRIDLAVDIFRAHMDKVRNSISKKNKNYSSSRKILLHKQYFAAALEDFGRWSSKFNRVLRKRINDMDVYLKDYQPAPDDKDYLELSEINQKLSWVYAYWWNRYHFITTQLSSLSKLKGKSTAKGIETGRTTIFGLIDGSVGYNILSKRFKDILNELSRMNAETPE